MQLSETEFLILNKLFRFGPAPIHVIESSFRNTKLDHSPPGAIQSLRVHGYVGKRGNTVNTRSDIFLTPKGKDFCYLYMIMPNHPDYNYDRYNAEVGCNHTRAVVETFLVQNAATGKAFGTPFHNEDEALEHAKAMAGAYNTVTQVVKLIKTVKYIRPVTTEGSFEVK
jgi:hypothetical protein